ncbi:peptidoglycan-recognition protein SB2-like [Culicoides brevitarsis]|uniref:peptidoglycan-recognition protein SB2-like n=1 Tax=Culicoides brevitarsis TaxID=469753 RepID=UPI00307B3A6C
MGHKVGTMTCKKHTSFSEKDRAMLYDLLERGESIPLLRKDYLPISSSPKKRCCDSGLVILSCFLIIGSIIGLYLLLEQDQKLKFNVPFFMVERSVLNFATPTKLLLGIGQKTSLETSTANAIVIQNTRFPQCFSKEMCTEIIKSLIALGVPVQQNFLIGGDGHVYEILGWDLNGSNDPNMLTVGFMGDFTNQIPPKLMFDVAKALISESIRRKRLNADYNVFGIRNSSLIVPDGEAMYENLALWPRWKNVIVKS